MIYQETVAGIPDAAIRRVDHLPLRLVGGFPAGPNAEAKPGQLLLVQPGVVSFLASDGKLIEFVHTCDADMGAVALFLNGSARGTLIHQRGELPLHAATLVPPGRNGALAICGSSGAGKSTLAAELCRRGWMLVADDTTRVTWDGSAPMAWPSGGRIKLWRDACEAADIDTAGLERITRDHQKYYLPVPSVKQSVRLQIILELAPYAGDTELSASERMALITRNTYRSCQIVPLGLQKQHVSIVAQIASTCKLSQLPAGRAHSVASLADAVERLAA